MNDKFEDLAKNNEEDSKDLESVNISDVVVYSRDWTIDTIYKQIKLGNIDINPKFQRRNAWNDSKRCKLIESIIMNYPIPEIVLAEDPLKKKSFIVIDGKQRLLTLAGFIDNLKFSYWTKPILRDLSSKEELNGLEYNTMPDDIRREFENASLRCSVITNYHDVNVLYDIFYRLNSGSTPLSTQELRQVLNKGDFADFLVDYTSKTIPLHKVMGIEGPDNRLRDVEVLLRIVSFLIFGKEYHGNLKNFLDESMAKINREWKTNSEKVQRICEKSNSVIKMLAEIFGGEKNVGRKWLEEGHFESRFNRVMLELEVFYFYYLIDKRDIVIEKKDDFLNGFQKLCRKNSDFILSFERSTKNIENYKIRYQQFEELINDTYEFNLRKNPFADIQ